MRALPPRVAFDVTPLLGTRTGIGRAVEGSLAALRGLPEPPAVIPYALGVSAMRGRRTLRSGTRIVPIPTRALLWAWSRSEHPRLDALLRPAQVIHATNFVAPPSELSVLVTVHDCTFARFADAASWSIRSFRPILKRAVARGSWLHCTTETVAAEIEELYGPGLRRSGRLVVIPFGVPRLAEPSMAPEALTDRLRRKPYILVVGAMEPRKNLPRLVRAFGNLAGNHPEVRLVLAGPSGPDRPAVEAAIRSLDRSARARVLLTGSVGATVLRTLIEGAAVLSYPSLYEGFGFPMLEAMSLGVPVVAARAGALPEVAGGAAHLIDPLDTDSIAGGLDLVLADGERRRELVSRGRQRVAAFSWERAARELTAVYEVLAGDDPRISA